MTKQPQQQKPDDTAAASSQALDDVEAQVQRTAALQHENAQLRAALESQQQVEATLRQREEQFRTLINNVPGAVYRAAFDDDWTIAFISDAIAKLTGYPATDFINNKVQSFNKLCHPDDLERVNGEIRAAIAAGRPFVIEYRNIRADGQVVWVCEQGHGVYDANGNGLWLDGVVLDITALKQTEAALRQSEKRLKLITDAVPVCIAYLDRNQCFQFANKTYETWFGLSAAALQGKPLSHVIGEAAYQLIQGHVERALMGEVTTYALELPYERGGSRYISAVLIPDADAQQQVQGYYALVIDISAQQAALRDRQQAEEAAKQQAERDRLFSAIAQRIRQSLHLEDILNTAVQEVRLLLAVDRALIYRFQPDQTGLVLVESVNDPWRSLQGKVMCGLTIEAFKRQQERGQTIIADIHHAGLEPFYIETFAQLQVRANLALPIVVSEQIWGLLVVDQCAAPREWQPWEVDFLTQLATQLAIAIQQSELFQQVQQLNTVLEGQVQDHINQLQQALTYEALLKRITDSVRDSLDENQIFQTVVRELAIGLKLNGCSNGLYDFEQQTLTIAHEHICYDLPPGLGYQKAVTIERDVSGRVLQGQCIQFCPLPEFSDALRMVQAKYAILACPIFVAVTATQASSLPELIGDLWLFRPKEDCFNEMEIRLVQQVTNQCAIAIRQSRLYQAAQAQVVELERLNQLKDDFLSTVSHELRTPMSNIKMATQMLEVTLFNDENFNDENFNNENFNNENFNDGNGSTIADPETALLDTNAQKASRYFQILKDEGEREIKLINDLLDLSRLDSGRDPLFLSTLPLQIWLPHVAEPFFGRTQTQQQALSIAVAPDVPPMATDFSYLERILSELLQNACKYTPSGETIAVLAQIAAVVDPLDRLSDRATIELTVTNAGIEISAVECDRIFDKFYRIPHNDPWKHGGTGLGLALVKKLVERLGGKIWAESANNQITFVMRFPRSLG